MPAHRQPELREEAPPPRRRVAGLRGRRRAYRRPQWLLPLALGAGLLGIGAIAGPSMVGNGWDGRPNAENRERLTYAALPADAPDQGLVYDGLHPAAAGSLCAGSYEISDQTCSHGPEATPAGLRVLHDVAPVTSKAPEPVAPSGESARVPSDAEVVRDLGGRALTVGAPALIPDAAPGDADFVLGPNDVACESDGRTGNRVQVLYLHQFGTPSRYTDFVGSIRTWSAGVDQIFDASAGETGGSRHVRFVTTPECRVDVAEVQVPESALGSFTRSIDALQTLGYNRTDRKYLLFADANVYCGIGTFMADQRPGQGNRNNGGPSYGRVDAGCWSSVVAARETTQMLGAVLHGSPNSTGAGSCLDDYDLLCAKDRSGRTARAACPKKHADRLDCGHDDYFSTSPQPGSFLAKNWNVARSVFLLRSDGGDDVPDADGAVGATTPVTATASVAVTGAPTAGPADSSGPPSPQPSAEAPTGAPSHAATQEVQAVVEVRDPTSTAVRLNWSPASTSATYEVSVDGSPVAITVATRAQLIGLKQDTSYQITVRSAARHYEAKATARTAPAARPAQNSWFVMANSLTGGAADLYAARTASGTPITLGGIDGDAQQQWMLVPARSGVYSLRSRATGKCVVPLNGNEVPGTPLVQGDCTTDDGARWALQTSDHGFQLRSTTAGLIIGVGDQHFGAHRVLTLQNANGARHQSWTAVPG
ncbi:MAG: hypothetical protein QOH97_2530 [Actinoplanes sp.]|nr:hypothetical protein [Actinoplanes sp.]